MKESKSELHIVSIVIPLYFFSATLWSFFFCWPVRCKCVTYVERLKTWKKSLAKNVARSVRNYRMSGVSAETECRLGGWMDAVCRASVSVMHHWRTTDVQLNLLKDCVPCEDNLLRSVLAETFSAARLVFTFGPTLPSGLLFHYVMLWLVRTSMTARLVLLWASVFMVFVKVLKSHSEDVQSCPSQRTVLAWNRSVLR